MFVCLEITKTSNDIKLGQDSTLVGEKIDFCISERPRNALDISLSILLTLH